MTVFTDIHITCWTCRGTGLKPQSGSGTVPCPACDGDGKVFYGHLDVTSLDAKLDDIIDKCSDIKEKVDEIKEVVDGL